MEEYKQFRDTTYYVSKSGKIVNRKNNLNKEVKGSKNNHGYWIVKIGGREGEDIPKARIVAEAWLGDITGMEVHHKSGNKDNNRLSNLEVLTPLQHIRKHNGYTGIAQFTLDWKLVNVYNTISEIDFKFTGSQDYRPSRTTPLLEQKNYYWLFFELSEKDVTFVTENVANREACDEYLLQVIEAEINKLSRGSAVLIRQLPLNNLILSKTALKGYEYTT